MPMIHSVVAALAFGVSVWLISPSWTLVEMRIESTHRITVSKPLVTIVAFAGWIAVVTVFGAPRAILSSAAAVVVVVLWWRWKRLRVAAHCLVAQTRCVELLEALAAELRAGAWGGIALARLSEEFPETVGVRDAHDCGTDVSRAWSRLASKPGYDSLTPLASAWAIAHDSGAPLSDVLELVAVDARAENELHREIAAAVAPAKTTALLMAALPVVAIGLGAGMGAAPLLMITETVWGALSVGVGSVLAVTGVVWVDRIAEKVEQV